MTWFIIYFIHLHIVWTDETVGQGDPGRHQQALAQERREERRGGQLQRRPQLKVRFHDLPESGRALRAAGSRRRADRVRLLRGDIDGKGQIREESKKRIQYDDGDGGRGKREDQNLGNKKSQK